MNTTCALLLLIVLNNIAIAQDTARTETKNRFAVSIHLNSPNTDDINVGWFDIDSESIDDYSLKHQSFSAGAALSYNLKHNVTLRLRVARTKVWIEESNNFEYVHEAELFEKEKYKGEQVKHQIAPAIIWKLRFQKLELYTGFELPVNLHGEYTFTSSVTGRAKDGDYQTYVESQVVIPNGFSVGVGAISGFKYYIHNRFSIGAEFSPSLLYSSLAGKTEFRTTVLIPEVPGYVEVPRSTDDANKGYTFYEQRFSLGVSYLFGK